MMFLSLPADGLNVPQLDLRPVAAVVAYEASTTYIVEFAKVADDFTRTMGAERVRFAASAHASLALHASAEAEGYHLDVSAYIARLESALTSIRGPIRDVKERIRQFVARATTNRAKGASMLHVGAQKIYVECDAWLNDIEDYMEEYKSIHTRMSIYKKQPPPISRVESAYRHAFSKVFCNSSDTRNPEHSALIVTNHQYIDDGILLHMIVKVDDGLLSDTEKLLQMEKMVHDAVSLEDSSLVGKVAVEYQAAS